MGITNHLPALLHGFYIGHHVFVVILFVVAACGTETAAVGKDGGSDPSDGREGTGEGREKGDETAMGAWCHGHLNYGSTKISDPPPRHHRKHRPSGNACALSPLALSKPQWCHDALADPLLGCPTLQVLALGKCHLSDAGASAAAAAALTELTLSETCISEAALQSVLSGCPGLRSLVLKHVHGLQRIRVSSCRSLVLLGVWHYKQLDEITVEDAPCLERLLGNMRLNAAITVTGAPKLTAFGYAVVSIPHLFHGERAPQGVNKGLRAPIHSVKILAISVKFSSKKDMEKFMRIQSEMCDVAKWVTEQQNLLSQSNMASLEAEVVFEGMKQRKDFTIEGVNALSDPFDGGINILGH
ncbi:hypothetical protein TRIUR3_19120 [Triticum urartu]|uniref:F-box/LRR-repeat protein 15/At3g58940/PEG3-like LRR domain-containing protein n=1 Tax=Triticum urartu TaxID=4572 RepID=M7ZZX1_TRIUA|nr:hypothetical protein TRIUR3_19120 [Triticum urartu]